jgi:hypothetical protein
MPFTIIAIRPVDSPNTKAIAKAQADKAKKGNEIEFTDLLTDLI